MRVKPHDPADLFTFSEEMENFNIVAVTERYRTRYNLIKLFQDGGLETSLLICSANQWTGFYMIGNSVLKDFK